MTTAMVTLSRSKLECPVPLAPKQKGGPFKDMMREDWEAVRKGEVGSSSFRSKLGSKQPLPPIQKGGPFKDMVSGNSLEEQLCSLTAKKVPGFVCKNKGKLLPLKKPTGAQLKIAAVEDTIYKYDPGEVNGWGKFYLPGTVTMQVIGVVEGIWPPCEELALMICGEDEHVYAYDEEELHLVASSIKELCDVGIEYPGTKTYYKGEAFKDMTGEDWEAVRKGEVGRELDEDHDKLVAKMNFSFLKDLK